ncbi:MAG TPA: hypothetical protein VFG54_06980 [Prolixibacteraceae bacterium]|nr:hypothetical protein [Prolixibacteraceae bacterium]
MNFKNHLCVFLLLWISFSMKISAKESIKFGKIAIEEFQEKVYAPDTSAVAVVLGQYGYFDATQFRFVSTRRIKILKKEGVNYASFVIRGGEDSNVRGVTYNLENGTVVEDKLKSESIFKERIIDNLCRYRFAMPNVKVGSIIDIEIAQSGLPTEFRFQETIPVKHAEIEIKSNPNIEFNRRQIGSITIRKDGDFTYYADNVPAFKNEPFMNSAENYMAKFEFDLLKVNLPGFYRNYTTTWESIDKLLRDNYYFGKVVFGSSNYLSEIADRIKDQHKDPLEKTRAAYEAIKTINWNKSESLTAYENTLSIPYKEKVANSAEINMMLCQLLTELNIEATPVVMSTRLNGTISPSIPSYSKLNYTIACANIDGKDYLMDATEKYLPLGMLPERCLNGEGRSFNKAQSGRWVSLIPENEETKVTAYDLQLGDDLTLKGKLIQSQGDYGAYNFRSQFKAFASEESFINDLETKNPGLRITDYKFEKIDSIYFPTNEEYSVEINNKVEKVNDLILVNPFLFEQVVQNPFISEERKYPINFPYLRTEMVVTKIALPDGLTIPEIPKPVSIELPDKSATVLINYSLKEKDLLVVYKLQINKLLFFPNEHELLKEMYSEIIKAQAQPIILKQL